MKTSYRFFQAFLVMLIFGISTCFAQETHYVTIHVDTNLINSQNEQETCYFTSESPGLDPITSEGNLEDFNITVAAGDTIIWRGVSSSSESDTVNVTSINYHGGDNVFDTNVLNGNGESPEEVVGVVKVDANGKVEKYTIKFTVLNNGERRGGTYQIDPKITVKP